MSLKKFYFDKDVKVCYTCKFIDEYTLNVAAKGEIPHGYDGTAICCKHNYEEKETNENRLWISPCWNACKKYEKCTKRQADYLDIFDNNTQTIIKNPNRS